ncbi:serine/threonine-protein phosphatase 2A regulatory subunit B'' subunit gamma-like isoform X1 [Oncorhynchus masou masou]|uniref:serine/threonine-protein phosphatase 2A regulatory subunit B'' subunit gamma-like isoform X1 n=1 Tax=Oncorhynchus masou masou TaxID=90313 RepID=UPI003183EE60
MWFLLDKHQVSPMTGEEAMTSYDCFLKFEDKAGVKCNVYLFRDYKTYVDFVLALENRKKPAALQYILKLLDMGNKIYLNVFALNYFFRDDIFDMVKPKDPCRI